MSRRPTKRQRTAATTRTAAGAASSSTKGPAQSGASKSEETPAAVDGQALVQFVDPDGKQAGPCLDLPLGSTKDQLMQVLNKLLENEEELPYSFHLEDSEIVSTLAASFSKLAAKSTERVLNIVYYPLAIFRVRSITRCTSSLNGHTEAVLCAAFSPDSQRLASGSGDHTVRLWDLSTELPKNTCQGHKGWVLTVAWSPDGSRLASAGVDKIIMIWCGQSGKPLGALKGHTQAVTCACWQPLHVAPEGQLPKLATASKDAAVRLWDTASGTCLRALTSHTAPVMQVRWSGERAELGGGYLQCWSRLCHQGLEPK